MLLIPSIFLVLLLLMLTMQVRSTMTKNAELDMLIGDLLQNKVEIESQLHSMSVKLESIKKERIDQ